LPARSGLGRWDHLLFCPSGCGSTSP